MEGSLFLREVLRLQATGFIIFNLPDEAFGETVRTQLPHFKVVFYPELSRLLFYCMGVLLQSLRF